MNVTSIEDCTVNVIMHVNYFLLVRINHFLLLMTTKININKQKRFHTHSVLRLGPCEHVHTDVLKRTEQRSALSLHYNAVGDYGDFLTQTQLPH